MSFLSHIGNTIFCCYQMKYNKEWDTKLNQLLDDYSHTAILYQHIIKLGDWEVWIANKWYSYGNAYVNSGKSVNKSLQFRPSIFTMRRLDRLVDVLLYENNIKWEKEVKEFYN